MKLAILLYGLFRHRDTPIFWRMMLPPGDIFLFSTFTSQPKTRRSHDVPLHARNMEVALNASRFWSVVDQDAYDAEIDLDGLCKVARNPFGASYTSSVRNAVRAIYQLRSLKRLFLAHRRMYTHVLLSRVDLLFTRRVDPGAFLSKAVVPAYASFGGVNDRFIAGPVRSVLLLMDRVDVWKRTKLLAERLLHRVIRHHNISVERRDVGLTRRVRGGGALHTAQYRKKGCALDHVSSMRELRPYRYEPCD